MTSRKGPILRLASRLAEAIARRFAVLENLLQRVPVDPELLTHAPFALAFDEHHSPNL